MQIVSLRAEAFKRLVAVSITPDGNVVTISGKNAAGKSSVLDAIEAALGGKRHVPERPVREGKSKARIVCDLGDIVVTRTFTAKGGGTLKVESKDGASHSSPQAMLDKLVGELSFDPLAFSRMDAKGQLGLLKSLVGLDFSGLDRKRREAYEERTAVGREMKRLEGQLAGLEVFPDAPEEAVDVAALLAEIDEATTAQKAIDDLVNERDDVRECIESAGLRLREIKAEIDALVAEAEEVKAGRTRNQAREAEFAQAIAERHVPDAQPLREQISNAEEINRQVRANARRREVAAEREAKRREVATLTDRIDAVDEEKREAMAGASFPVKGLGFDEDGVTFAGVPFAQASSAEQLRVSVAMGLALNPELRVLLIRDGSLLDEESLRMLGKMAAEAGAQVWLERVSDGDAVGVVIEDGAVAGAEAVEADAAE